MTFRSRNRKFRRNRRFKNKFKKRLRSKYQIQKIAQAVVMHNQEVKVQDQAMVAYPRVAVNHNVWTQLFDNLTLTRQGVENQPATNFSNNRVGSSITPSKLWIKGLIELNAMPSGYPITKCLVRFVLVRRAMSRTVDGTNPALPSGLPKADAQTSQTNLNTLPNNFLANIDQRSSTVVYDKIHSIKTEAMTQSNAAPDYPARGNEVSKTFNININLSKWTRGGIEYSYQELTTPSGNHLPKKYAFQLYAIAWTNSGYDPAYVFSAQGCHIIAQSRMYFRDA